MLRITTLIAGIGLLAAAATGQTTAVKDTGNLGKIPIVATLKLEVQTKPILGSPAWGTSSSAITQTSPGDVQAKAIDLRYFVGKSSDPSRNPITIDASDTPDFKKLYKFRSFTPNIRGLIAAGQELSLPAPYGTVIIGNTATWYLRARNNLTTSNAVKVVMAAKKY